MRPLALAIEQAALDARSPREFLDRLASIVRAHFGAWLSVAAMPSQTGLFAIDSVDDVSPIDPELIRLQIQRSSGTATATTIRLADGRGARSLQVALGDSACAVGIAIVHLPERTPDAATQLEQMRTLSIAAEAAYRGIHTIGDRHTPIVKTSSAANDVRLRYREFHRSLDVQETALAIAAEAAWLVDCDRVCVLLREGTSFRLKAVTGVDVIDRRGNESKCLERLVARAMAVQSPLVYPHDEPLPPQLEAPLAEYLDQSLVQSGVLVPLTPSSESSTPRAGSSSVLAAIAFERFRGQPITAVTPAMQAVCDEAMLAIANSQIHQSIFLLPLWKTAGRLMAPATRHKTIAATLLAVALLIASLVVQVDYKITATGTIEPQVTRNLFAPSDGVVAKLHVADGDFVEEGELLVEIESADLQRQTEQITGELHTAREKLASIDAVLVAGGSSRRDVPGGDQLTIERRQLQSQIESLLAQQAVIVAEKERQSMRSPIKGQVIGWRLKQRLEQRPVSRGHRLFSVVDNTGPRLLKLHVPDRDSGELLAYASSNSSMHVEYVIATEPDRTGSAMVIEIATATRLDSQGVNQLDLTAKVAPDQAIDANIGAEVTAAIHCGRRSFLAAWFGDIADFYHRHIRFYLS